MSTQPSIDEIEYWLARHFNYRQNLVVPNVSWGMGFRHELDLLVVRKSGYAFEVEIKRSIQDLKAELKKRHNHGSTGYSSPDIRELWFAYPVEIKDAAQEFLAQHFPRAGQLSYELRQAETGHNGYYSYKLPRRLKIKTECRPKINTAAKRLSEKQRQDILRLAAMRVWSLKKKYGIPQPQ